MSDFDEKDIDKKDIDETEKKDGQLTGQADGEKEK